MIFIYLTMFIECLLCASHTILSPGGKQWTKQSKYLHSWLWHSLLGMRGVENITQPMGMIQLTSKTSNLNIFYLLLCNVKEYRSILATPKSIWHIFSFACFNRPISKLHIRGNHMQNSKIIENSAIIEKFKIYLEKGDIHKQSYNINRQMQ